MAVVCLVRFFIMSIRECFRSGIDRSLNLPGSRHVRNMVIYRVDDEINGIPLELTVYQFTKKKRRRSLHCNNLIVLPPRRDYGYDIGVSTIIG